HPHLAQVEGGRHGYEIRFWTRPGRAHRLCPRRRGRGSAGRGPGAGAGGQDALCRLRRGRGAAGAGTGSPDGVSSGASERPCAGERALTAFEFDWVDAFTDRPFGGNGCAVFHQAGAIDAETCMAIVRETSLVECTFLEPSSVADIRVRYFLASREIPFAGHPTIATVASLLERGMAGPGRVTLETGAGI